jgi:hypothetical protein
MNVLNIGCSYCILHIIHQITIEAIIVLFWIKNAKRQMEDNKGKSDAEITPATKVYLLVEELAKYFPEEIKCKFI